LLYSLQEVKQVDVLDRLNSAISYIEQHLRERIDFGEAARIACVSQDSFQRFFSYMTGMTLTEYVRRRRLSLAAFELQKGRKRVIDVALDYGYESVDAFSRAFVRQHGMPPSAVHQQSRVHIYPPASFRIVIKGAREMDFRWIYLKEEMDVYGISKAYPKGISREVLRHSMWDEDCDDVPGQLCEGKWNEPGNHAYDGAWYGLWRDGCYMIAREKDFVKSGDFEKKTLAAGKYAAFTTPKGGVAWEEIPKLREQIFDAWLPDSGFRLRNDDVIEVLHLWTDRDARRKNRYYEIWIPIEE